MASLQERISGWNRHALKSSITDLMETLDYVESLLQEGADPVHSKRLEEIAERLGHTQDLLICG